MTTCSTAGADNWKKIDNSRTTHPLKNKKKPREFLNTYPFSPMKETSSLFICSSSLVSFMIAKESATMSFLLTRILQCTDRHTVRSIALKWQLWIPVLYSQIFVRYPFSYFSLETSSYKLIFVLSRASKQNNIKFRGPQSVKKFSYGIKFSTFKSTTVRRKFVTLYNLQ